MNYGPGPGIEVTEPVPPVAPDPVPPGQTPVVVTAGAGAGYGTVCSALFSSYTGVDRFML